MRTLTLFSTTLALLLPGTSGAVIEDQPLPPAAESPPPSPAPVLTRVPELIELVPAAYPAELEDSGEAGEVILLIDIDAAGQVERVEVQSATHPAFAAAALEAAVRFVFSPAEIDHQPAAIRIEYRYTFTPELPVPDVVTGAPRRMSEAELPVNFAGLVREAGTRKPIAAVTIRLNGVPTTETDNAGRFAVHGAPIGPVKIVLEALGYESYEIEEELSLATRTEAKYYLVRRSANPFEVVVRTRAERREVAKIELSREELKKVPGTFGDPVRVIENLPGMGRTPGGLGGALLVRGDRPSSTAVYFDGVRIPLLYHFGGLTSVVNAEFLEAIDFYPGGFGARFGDATAGIVEIKTRDLACEMWRGSGKIDIIDASAFTCLPVGGWHVAAAARRSYIDVMIGLALGAMPREEGQGSVTAAPVYWDYQVKASRRVGSHRIDLFAFGADDTFRLLTAGSAEEVNIEFGLHLASHRLLARHRWQLTPELSLTSQLAPGYLLQGFTQSAAEIGSASSFDVDLWSADWREELIWQPHPWLTLRAGLDHRFGEAGFSFELPLPTDIEEFPSPTFDLLDTDRFSRQMGVRNHAYWLELNLGPWAGLTFIPGLRLDRWDYHQTQDFSLSPRATVRYQAFAHSVAKAAYGLYEKLPDPAFVLIDRIGNPRLDPERTQQFIVGWEQELTELVTLDLQGFINLRQSIVSFSQSSRWRGGRLAPEIWSNDGSSRTFGLEILLRHLATADGRFYGWLAYTLSRTRERDYPEGGTYTIERPDGTLDEYAYSERATREYPATFDQTHILTLVGQWLLPWGLEAGLRFRLVTGNPYTPIDRGRVFYDDDLDSYQLDVRDVRRNSERMPTFHSLDLRIDKTFTLDLGKVSVYLELINAYGHRNVEGFSYDYRYRNRVPLSLYPILPNLGLRGEF